MTLPDWISTYVTLNLLIAAAYLGLKVCSGILDYLGLSQSSQNELRTHYWALFFILFLTGSISLEPSAEFFEPIAKVWSAPSLKSFSSQVSNPESGGYLAIALGSQKVFLNGDLLSLLCIVFGLSILGVGVTVFVREIRGLFRLRKNSYLLRRIGRVAIYAHDQVSVPFSYWLPGQRGIMIPSPMIAHPLHFRISIAHELQHHRQGDVRWIYVMLALRWVCVLNPFMYLWFRKLEDLQEFACDEALLGRSKVKSLTYARCLVEVAEYALNQKMPSVCRTGVRFLVEQNLLKRRIEKMSLSSKKVRGSVGFALGGVMFSLLAATAFASKGMVGDRRVTMDQALEWKEQANSSEFPVVVNDLVLIQLNRYLGTPEGRDYMKSSLKRMDDYRSLVEGKLREYQVPMEIMAIPIVESGYKNLEERKNIMYGAGLWQFIRPTAAVFGLKVDESIDERLNPVLATDAAMRYLLSNKLRFNDWHLSVLAYNIGESRVQKAIDELKSRDAWVLLRRGYENDKNYLAKVMAAILIMKNPSSLD